MSGFAVITMIWLGIVVVGILAHTIIRSPRGKGPLWLLVRAIRLLFGGVGRILPSKDENLVAWLSRLAAAVAAISTVVLALTGFVPALQGQRLSGYLLLIHVSLGPVLVVAMTFWVLTKSARFTYSLADWEWLCARTRPDCWFIPNMAFPGPFAKLCFWALVVLIIPLGLSIVLSMFRLFDTDLLVLMEQIHRYCALAFLGLGMIYLYLFARDRTLR